MLFISAVGEAGDRRLSFAHFQDRGEHDLPTLRVIAWDADDTVRRLSAVNATLRSKLEWRRAGELEEAWQARWRSAFTERPAEGVRTADELAKVLATLARRIRDRIKLILPVELKGKAGPLKTLYDAVKATLSRDLTPDAFADTYAQTIAYGLLSARITEVERLRAATANPDRDLGRPLETLRPLTADAAGAAMPVTNPFLRDLFTQFLSAGGREREAGKDGAGLDFDELGVSEVIDFLNDLDDRLHAVLLDFDRNRAGEDPVIHLYEGFLKAYDAKLRQTRGVYYTPKPVVGFIVRSVDEVLRTEFGLKDGLADTTTWGEFVEAHPETKIPAGVSADEAFVQVLDPATGTGTFLVEIIDLIHDRLMTETWKGKSKAEKRRLWNEWVPRWLLPRLYGFELMMAPYAVAHMKIGLKLQDTDYDFKGTECSPDGKPRPARARVFLTNALEPAQDLDSNLSFMSDALAQEARAANDAKANARFTVVVGNPPYSSSISEPPSLMKKLGDWKKDLNETKVDLNREEWKFLLRASILIREAGLGQIGFVVNRDYLDGITKRIMRMSLANQFLRGLHVDLNGDVRGEIADENVFEIMQGVSICLLSTMGKGINYFSLTGSAGSKFDALANPETDWQKILEQLQPFGPYYRWLPASKTAAAGDRAEYDSFPRVVDVLPTYSSGVQTKNDYATVSIDKADAWRKVQTIAAEPIAKIQNQFSVGEKGAWSASSAKADLVGSGPKRSQLRPILYNPFDIRWTYYTGVTSGFHARPRREVMQHVVKGENLCLMFNRQVVGEKVTHFGVTEGLAVHGTFYLGNKGQDYVAPLWLFDLETSGPLSRPNLATAIMSRLAVVTDLTWNDRAAAKIRQSRSPKESNPLRPERGDLAATFGARDVFDWIYAVLHSPTYRERYADFLKSDFARIPLARDRKLFADLVPLGTRLVALHLLNAEAAPELDEPKPRFAGSGMARVEKGWPERKPNGRVYINATRWFEPVPESVWEHWIGGYQPAQKWLSDRSPKGGKHPSLGRVLTDEDTLHYRRMIVALAETAKTMAKIDAVIFKHGGFPDAFKGMTD